MQQLWTVRASDEALASYRRAKQAGAGTAASDPPEPGAETATEESSSGGGPTPPAAPRPQ